MGLMIFLSWYIAGWWYAQHVWRKQFSLDPADAVLITFFAWAGPFTGLLWEFSLWMDRRPRKPRPQVSRSPRKPITILQKHAE